MANNEVISITYVMIHISKAIQHLSSLRDRKYNPISNQILILITSIALITINLLIQYLIDFIFHFLFCAVFFFGVTYIYNSVVSYHLKQQQLLQSKPEEIQQTRMQRWLISWFY